MRLKRFAPLVKVDEEQRMVWGYASTEAPDGDGVTVTRAAMETALPDYLRWSNIREMHQLSAVGTAEEIGLDEKGLYIGAHIVDDTAWRKVQSGVYKGFSIGGRITARDPGNPDVVTGLILSEISLVDRPSNPECAFDLFKADASGQESPEMPVRDRFRELVSALGELLRTFSEENDSLEGIRKAEPAPSHDALRKAHESIAALERRIVELEASPAPPRGVRMDLSKSVGISKDDECGVVSPPPIPTDPVDLIKAVHATGGRLLRG